MVDSVFIIETTDLYLVLYYVYDRDYSSLYI